MGKWLIIQLEIKMKKTINGIEYKTFPEDKTIKELGIDTSRRFIVLKEGNPQFDVGDIIKLKNDDNTSLPLFSAYLEGGGDSHCGLSRLAYYDEPKPKKFYVGQRLRMLDNHDLEGEGKVVTVAALYNDKPCAVETDGTWGWRWNGRDSTLKDYKPISAHPLFWYVECYEGIWEDIDKPTTTHFENWLELEEYKHELIKTNKLTKTMGIIKNLGKSKARKALEYFDLVNEDGSLKSDGRIEFIHFIYETGSTDRKEFEKKIIQAYEESIKK